MAWSMSHLPDSNLTGNALKMPFEAPNHPGCYAQHFDTLVLKYNLK